CGVFFVSCGAPRGLLPFPTRRSSDLAQPPSLPLVPQPGRKPKPSPLLHPCSGKHAALLQACRRRGWDTHHYTSADHPLHAAYLRSEEHTSELQSRENLVCRLLLEKKK